MKKRKKKGYRRQKICAWLLLLCMVVAMCYTPALVRAEEELPKQEELQKEEPEDSAHEDSKAVMMNPQQLENMQPESYAVSDGNYDTTKPVIEEVILQEQGQTVNLSDTIHIKVKAYDAESEIREVIVGIGRRQNDGIMNVARYTATYNSQTGYYECTYKVSEDKTRNRLCIYEVSVTDVYSNMEKKHYSETEYYCNVNIEDAGDSDVTNTTGIESITLKNEGKYLKVGDKETITIKPSEKPSENSIYKSATVYWTNGYGSYSMNMSLPYDEQRGVYEKEITISPRMKSGVWKISSIYLAGNYVTNDTGWKNRILIDNEDYQPLNITIKQHEQKLTAGDAIDITVTNLPKGLRSVSIQLKSSILDVSPNYKYYSLTYDDEKYLYYVADTVGDEMYPCEWYVSQTSYDYDEIHYTEPINQESASITISKNGTVVTPTAKVNISFYRVDDNGNWTSVYDKSFENVTSKDTMRSLGITELPDGQSSFAHLTFEGWVKEGDDSANSDAEVLNSRILRSAAQGGNTYYIRYYAKYDKDIVGVSAESFQNDEPHRYVYENIAVPRNTATEEILSKYISKSKGECNIAKFQKWEVRSESNYYGYRRTLWVRAKYDKAIVQVGGRYFANDNSYRALPCPKAVAVDYGASYQDVIRTIQGQLDRVEHHPQIGFTGWKYKMQDSNYKVVEDGTALIKNGYESIQITPIYQNCVVSMYVSEKDNGEESGYQDLTFYDERQVVKKGDTFTLPTEVEGCTELEWEYYWMGEEERGEITKSTYVITDDVDFYGSAIPTNTQDTPKPDDSTNQNPQQEENTTNSGDATQPQDSPKQEPSSTAGTNHRSSGNRNHTNATATSTADTSIKEPTTLTTEKVQDIITVISETDKGKAVTVEMGNATVIDKKILGAAKENGVNLVLQMDGYSWTIDAGSIKASDLQSINLEVNLNANAIPDKAVSKLAGDNPTKQISLTHEGNFGFSATLKFNLGKEYKDKYGNLYWYDSDGKMVFVDAGVIDENGDVSLRFSHASDYVIVMKDTKDTAAGTQVKNAQKASEKSDIKQPEENKTVNPAIWITAVIVLMAGIACGVIVSKKKAK